MSKPTIEEQVEAVKTLRHAATGRLEACSTVREAIRILDSADLFADLDDKRNARETASVPRTPVAIVKLHPTLFQARGASGHVWATATTYAKVEERLAEEPTAFIIVTREELAKYALPQTYDTPRCKHCSDPLDENGGDLVTGETFCGANPDNDRHEPEEA